MTSPRTSPDCYAVLEIGRDTDFASIKKAYFRMAKTCHPDLFGGDRGKEEEFKQLVAAFDILSDPQKRRRHDLSLPDAAAAAAAGLGPLHGGGDKPVMDSDADDILEELIVGNSPPPGTTLSTLFLDLASTRVFMTFREGKNLLSRRQFAAAAAKFGEASAIAPNNILYHYFLGNAYLATGQFSMAARHYQSAIDIGARSIPPQRLERARVELEAARRRQHPWWQAIAEIFEPPRETHQIPEDARMIDETNRAIARIEREQKEKQRMLNK